MLAKRKKWKKTVNTAVLVSVCVCLWHVQVWDLDTGCKMRVRGCYYKCKLSADGKQRSRLTEGQRTEDKMSHHWGCDPRIQCARERYVSIYQQHSKHVYWVCFSATNKYYFNKVAWENWAVKLLPIAKFQFIMSTQMHGYRIFLKKNFTLEACFCLTICVCK